MNKQILASLGALTILACAGCSTSPSHNQENTYTTPANLDCKLSFSLTGWSIIYKHADGQGTVHCANGKSMPVTIAIRGGGLTAGKWHVDNGSGKFSDVHQITDVLGDYAHAGAHVGVVKSGSAQVLTKGTVSLVLAGTGQGVDLGVDVGRFTISRR